MDLTASLDLKVSLELQVQTLLHTKKTNVILDDRESPTPESNLRDCSFPVFQRICLNDDQLNVFVYRCDFRRSPRCPRCSWFERRERCLIPWRSRLPRSKGRERSIR